MAAAAALALTAALLHVFNHSLFKSLLFFGAGAVLHATGERDMEQLGGLIHRMPQTAFVFLVGCVAISALPPFNGFVSEWLTFQAILLSPQLPSWGLKFLVPAVGRAAGAGRGAGGRLLRAGLRHDLSRPAAFARGRARARDRPLFAGRDVRAGGALPRRRRPAGPLHRRAGAGRAGARRRADAGADRRRVAVDRADRREPQLLQRPSGVRLHRRVRHARGLRDPPARLRPGAARAAWDCGYPDASAITQYTAESFAQPIRRVFGTIVFRAREHVDMPPPGDIRPARLTVEWRDLVWDLLYAPIAAAVMATATTLNQLQFLTIRQFLSLVFAALVLLLLVLAIWP